MDDGKISFRKGVKFQETDLDHYFPSVEHLLPKVFNSIFIIIIIIIYSFFLFECF